ncbi:sensor histidine kinase [Amycolatopsis cihanbeyliensis]|uniref:histidine kinase n=1 Tax=Amycolatopsis cihanbeyliensis TaxID=1128664 RepID=A0A542DHM4_AMYCI|nr:HAMP domain-containing sensor histidine kinase [Amycolatopsis cihanbeyliensis]TQJ02582.1 signal transduction histidine kinase [Amycolatopsis cihanbeyliensis]
MIRSPRHWWLRRSLRFRITLLAVTITLAFLVGLAALAGKLLGPLLVQSVDEELREALAPASQEVSQGYHPPERSMRVPVRVLDTAGTPVDGGGATGLDAEEIDALKAGLAVRDRERDGPHWRWLGVVVTAPDGYQRLVVAGAPMVGFRSAVVDGSRWLLMVALVAAIVAAAATWAGVGSALRPVGRMRRSVRGLPPGGRLPLPEAHDELRSLAAEFNTLLARQEEVSERLRRFTGDAAHELRSPVASIRVQAEVAVANPDPELSQDTLADVLDEAERLSTLLDGLLALARSDAGELPAAEPVDLVTEVHAAVGRLPADAPAVRVSAAVPSAWAMATHAEVELVLNNLLRNACRYAEAQIVVSVLASRSLVRVVVDDDGPGVDPEHREHVFDRFYRVADDRARESGGTGLGLAMVAEAARRRGGRVLVGESPDGGARFQVIWPANRS